MIKDRIDSMFVQARFYFNLEKYSSALRIYSKIINYFKNYEKVLDSSYRDRYFAPLYYLNRYEESIEYYNKAIGINPVYEKAFINKGIILAKLMVFDEALEAFNIAIEINEKSEISYFNIGIIYSKLERYEDALYFFNKAAELGYDYAYLNVAIILEKLGKIDEAFEVYNKAIDTNKSLEVIYLNKAGLLVNIGKYQEAIKYLDKALAILDDNNSRGDTIIKNKEPIEYMGIGIMENDTIYDRIYFLKSAALINLSQYDYALTLLLNIKESNSVNIFYIISRFIEYISIEKLINIILKEDSFWVEEKEEYFNFIVRDIEENNRAKLKKLWILQYVFLYLISVKDYDKVIELDPNYVNAYNNRGNAKSDLKLYEEAIKDYDKAIELDNNDSTAYYNRGNTKSDLKLYEEAVKDYDKAIELDPNYADAYNNRSVAKFNLFQYEEAIKDYKKSLELDSKNNISI